MVYPQNYKTVFVFDHGPKMLSPSDEEYEYDVANKKLVWSFVVLFMIYLEERNW